MSKHSKRKIKVKNRRLPNIKFTQKKKTEQRKKTFTKGCSLFLELTLKRDFEEDVSFFIVLKHDTITSPSSSSPSIANESQYQIEELKMEIENLKRHQSYVFHLADELARVKLDQSNPKTKPIYVKLSNATCSGNGTYWSSNKTDTIDSSHFTLQTTNYQNDTILLSKVKNQNLLNYFESRLYYRLEVIW